MQPPLNYLPQSIPGQEFCFHHTPNSDFCSSFPGLSTNMANRAAEGLAALNSHDYPKAISCYTAALLISPSSPDYYLKRSMAHQRSTPPDYHGALSDATMAVVAATRRAKRELIAAAQLRRAIALYCLERYADAAFLFDVVQELDPKEKSLAIHQSQTKAKLAALPEGDERAIVTVAKLPDVELSPALPESKGQKGDDASAAQSAVEPGKADKAPDTAPPQKIKHEWYQSSGKIHLTLLAKGVARDSVTVDIQPLAVGAGLGCNTRAYKSGQHIISHWRGLNVRSFLGSTLCRGGSRQVDLQRHCIKG